MFDAEHDSGSNSMSANDPDVRPSRRQYTLKGVEADTIRLMRDAASKEGMKIGSWVSLRMKQAAERALERTQNTIHVEDIANESDSQASPNTHADILLQIFQMLIEQRSVYDNQLARIERELHELTSGQRTIMSGIIEDRVSQRQRS